MREPDALVLRLESRVVSHMTGLAVWFGKVERAAMNWRSGTAFGVLVVSLPTGGLRYRCDPRLLSANPSG